MPHTITQFISVLLFAITINANGQDIKIASIDYSDFNYIEDYPFNEIQLEVSKNSNYSYVKVKSISKILTENDILLPYFNDTYYVGEGKISNKGYVNVSDEKAILPIWFKSADQFNIKYVSGILTYIKKDANSIVSGNLSTDLGKNMINDKFSFQAFKYNKDLMLEYKKTELIPQAKKENKTVEEVLKNSQFLSSVFGPDEIEIKENQIILLLKGNLKNIIFIKFFDSNNMEIIPKDVHSGLELEKDFMAFNFNESPKNDWKISFYLENESDLVDIPFEIKLN